MDKYNLSLITLILFLIVPSLSGQLLLDWEIDLSRKIRETSGIIIWDDRGYTHNDAGNDPILYELDLHTGEIIRKIKINNVPNIDWEDIAQDSENVYIGDFGNNDGNRKDLAIYIIKKSELGNQSKVDAEIITFSYQDQIDFSAAHHATNFDAEAMVVIDKSIYLFTKNWLDLHCNVYKLSTSISEQQALRVNRFDSKGLITGADYNNASSDLYFCGYTTLLQPFLIKANTKNVLQNESITTEKIDISSLIGIGSQTEALAIGKENDIYLTRERLKKKVNGIQLDIDNSMFRLIEEPSEIVLPPITKPQIHYDYFNQSIFIESKNPSDFMLNIYDINGQNLLTSHDHEISLTHTKSGLLFIEIIYPNNQRYIFKFIKI